VTDRTQLLDHAQQVLDGTIALGSPSARTSALLTRCAFEQWLDEQSAPWSATAVKRPTTNSKLVVLAALKGQDIGEKAKQVWNGLSRACHHHAYELQPSAAEVRALLAKVRELEEAPTSGAEKG